MSIREVIEQGYDINLYTHHCSHI